MLDRAQPAGYSGTPLVRKLGFRDGDAVRYVAAPPAFRELIGPLPAGAREAQDGPYDLIVLFASERAVLAEGVPLQMAALQPAGMLWVAWPKRASKVPTDITEDVVREVALPLGLVDTKVCAIDEVWSGLKLVIRRALRR
jgi:hypothetical protein